VMMIKPTHKVLVEQKRPCGLLRFLSKVRGYFL
jgi:hypothetical protein